MYTPAYPNFTIQKWGLVGYTFHGHVFMMYSEIMGRLFETMEVFVDEGRQSKSSAFTPILLFKSGV